jgi:exosortase A-associated hydrolase 2
MLPAGAGRDDTLMALWHAPQAPHAAHGEALGVVLYVHPFAEEMNKSRRMAALQARALAAAGYGVLQIDLKGCGDSSGEFGDATWADWLADVNTGVRWLRERSTAPLTLWGLRAGCLLLSEAAAQWPDQTCNFVFWQPTPSGAAVLRQFLRHAAAAAFLDGGGKGVVDKLRRQLADGDAVEVGGYRVHPAMGAGLDQARLQVPPQVGQVTWLEISALINETDTAQALNATSAAAAAPWREAASDFEARIVAGPPFWQTAEIEIAPALIEATVAALAPRQAA